MEQLLQAQLQAEREGRTYAVVTIAEASGSVPRTNGKLLVLSSGQTCAPSAADLPSTGPYRTRCGRWMGPILNSV